MSLRSPIFISYAHEDLHYLDKLLTHLEPLRMQDEVCAWSDKGLQPGLDWIEAINTAISRASIYVLLISKHFLASEFIRKSELPALLSRKQNMPRPVIPVLLSPCLYDLTSFKYPEPETGPGKFDLAAIQFFNDTNKPLSILSEHDQDILYVNLAKKLHEIAHPFRPRPVEKDLFAAKSPDDKKDLTLREAQGTGLGFSTVVAVDFGTVRKDVYAVNTINLGIKTYWKDNNTIVIETWKHFRPYKKWRQIEAVNEVVNVEYIET